MDSTRIWLGKFSSADEIRAALKGHDTPYSGVEELIDNISLVSTRDEQEVELVALTRRELGLDQWGTFDDVIAAIESKDCYDICQQECGPRARLAYSGDQNLVVVMEPVKDSRGEPFAFALQRHYSAHVLSCLHVGPDERLPLGAYRFVVRRKP